MKRITQNRDIGATCKRLEFKYAGHMYREEERRWNRMATDWTPYEREGEKEGDTVLSGEMK